MLGAQWLEQGAHPPKHGGITVIDFMAGENLGLPGWETQKTGR